MKPYHLILFAIILISSCRKPCLPERSFKARLLASFCGYHIVQVEDGHGTYWGMNWTNSAGTSYPNVFTVANTCDFMKLGLKAGESFMATVIELPEQDNCAVCDGYMETPPLKRSIKVIR
ncbi:hypothetical protein ESA94_05930 [Lacibacter luteus]|uniref:Uncharacterized protein n=1 Tax=Lacibacter luteus TaxID=2508719 RepID=A0A4Q1CN55_9BACT|nr:hypothetical protein [Lacibacter luteus]RXK62537.1 hypothetical protein ESA94_05930 [Lacibacter luteus]